MLSSPPPAVLETEFPNLRRVSRGKVRDMYEVDGGLLIVTTDRLSAFDVVLPTPIPAKGVVLNELSLFWFDLLRDVVPGHVLTGRLAEMPAAVQAHAALLRGRSMLVRRASVFPVECIVRGYLAGSGWLEYQRQGTVCGIPLPAGLAESARLPEPLFTPSTKAETGHDENIPYERMVELIGAEHAGQLRDTAVDIYQRAATYALERGIIIADTKFEFGLIDGRVTLVDEVLTPDSSRFWPVEEYREGAPPPSFDKQYVRDYLTAQRWDRRPPAPALPEDVVRQTTAKYLEAFRVITGRELAWPV